MVPQPTSPRWQRLYRNGTGLSAQRQSSCRPTKLKSTPNQTRRFDSVILADSVDELSPCGEPASATSARSVGRRGRSSNQEPDASAGIGLAIPSNTVARVVPQLIQQGRYPHPWLGVNVLDLTPERVKVLREAGLEVPVEYGILAVEVVPGSPAEAAGIRRGERQVNVGNARIPWGGDIIVGIEGQSIADLQGLTVYLEAESNVGDTVEVTIIRDGQEQTLSVTLDERPERS